MRSPLVITLAEREGRLRPGLILPPPLAAEAMVIGLAPEQAVESLGRIFNLCRHAQEAAARLAFGLPAAASGPCRAEILRDSLFRLFIALPGSMGRPTISLPKGWQSDHSVLGPAMFGPIGHLPKTGRAFLAWLKSSLGLAPVLAALTHLFAPGEAASRALPYATGTGELCENSAAMRHADHPVMEAIEGEWGRGPFWRTVARLLDVQACMDDRLPSPRLIAPGLAEAPATRGSYRIKVSTSGGCVTEIRRHTPTDDICQPDGALLSALSALPLAKRHLAPIVMECFDPCLPWHIRETQDA